MEMLPTERRNWDENPTQTDLRILMEFMDHPPKKQTRDLTSCQHISFNSLLGSSRGEQGVLLS